MNEVRVSPSQVKTFRECQRLWGWQRILPKEPSGEAALRGEAVHKVGEDWATSGTPPDAATEAGQIFLPGLPHLPPPFVGVAEGWFLFERGGVTFHGRKDLSCVQWDLPGEDATAGAPVNIDLKTVKTIRTGPRGNVLDGVGGHLDDPQSLTYAVDSLLTHPDAPYAHQRWVYLQATGKHRAKVSEAQLHRGETFQAFDRIVLPIGKEIVRLHTLGTIEPLTLAPSPDRCHLYGPNYPCAHVARCGKLTQPELTFDEEESDTPMANTLFDDLDSWGQEPLKPSTPAPVATTPEPEPVKASEPLKALKAAAKTRVTTVVEPAPTLGINPAPLPFNEVRLSDTPTNEELGRVVRWLLQGVQ